MKAFTVLWALVFFASTVVARTVFSELAIDGFKQGPQVAVRVPSSNEPITDVLSNDMICNTDHIQPVSQTILSVKAGSNITALFYHTPAGYIGPDLASPIDSMNKGPVMVYLAKVFNATHPRVTGLKWFKIWEDGYDPQTREWGTDHLIMNEGKVNFEIPSCIISGQYLLRVEAVSLLNAEKYPGAEFFMSCAQINIVSGYKYLPTGVLIPGAYQPSDSGVVADIFDTKSYTPPGPPVVTC